jgi:hypothetical protein
LSIGLPARAISRLLIVDSRSSDSITRRFLYLGASLKRSESPEPTRKVRYQTLHAHRCERFEIAYCVDGPDMDIQSLLPCLLEKIPRRELLLNVYRSGPKVFDGVEWIFLHVGTKDDANGGFWS